MDFYGKKNLWKFILLFFAISIGGITLWYTETFLEELRQEEIKKVSQFANAVNYSLEADLNTDLSLASSIIDNTTVPIILTDANGNILSIVNLDEKKINDTAWIRQKMQEMASEIKPIEVIENNQTRNYIYYENSLLLTKLRLYPIVLLIVISVFIGIAYIAFSNARKAEQNQVWNGLAKETAHQIGTPLTSLVGWIELLKGKGVGDEMVEEMEKDVMRLNTITDRFSKIGSKPHLQPYSIKEITASAVEYLKNRSPRKIEVSFEAEPGTEDIVLQLNKPLFEWVIENLIRNAIDAIEAPGEIRVNLSNHPKHIRIDVEDTGKGIPANKLKVVFRPGYSTKRRGWGLGLSLAKRIIEEYHNGKIFIVSSEVGKGTTFRIQLKKD